MAINTKFKKIISISLVSLALLLGCNFLIHKNVESRADVNKITFENLGNNELTFSINSKGVSKEQEKKLKERVEFIKRKEKIPTRLKLKGIDDTSLKQIKKTHREDLI